MRRYCENDGGKSFCRGADNNRIGPMKAVPVLQHITPESSADNSVLRFAAELQRRLNNEQSKKKTDGETLNLMLPTKEMKSEVKKNDNL